jgi:hypothetical protein
MKYKIIVDYTRDKLFDEMGLRRLKDSYMREDDQSPQDRYAFVSAEFASNQEHAQRLYDYASNHWLSYSTPILSFGRSRRGLPISCFAGNTIVKTEFGYESIESLKPGDKVLSHDGLYHEIVKTKESYSEDIYELVIDEETFHVTGNHLILTQEDGWIQASALDPLKHTLVQIQGPLSQ